MKKIKIMLDGREIEAEISDEQAEKLTQKERRITGLERALGDGIYWYNGAFGKVYQETDDYWSSDNNTYDAADYYTDKSLAEDDARFYRLHRQLKRFAVMNRSCKPDWTDRDNEKWRIDYSYGLKELITLTKIQECAFGAIYFDSEELAQKAIEEFRDDLEWYFTEYRDSL